MVCDDIFPCCNIILLIVNIKIFDRLLIQTTYIYMLVIVIQFKQILGFSIQLLIYNSLFLAPPSSSLVLPPSSFLLPPSSLLPPASSLLPPPSCLLPPASSHLFCAYVTLIPNSSHKVTTRHYVSPSQNK